MEPGRRRGDGRGAIVTAPERDEATSAEVAAVVERHRGVRGPLLPILHDLQRSRGVLDGNALDLVADALNISRAEVVGVASFYRDFRDEPAGRVVVRVCRGEACQAMGADALLVHATTSLATPVGSTSTDGAVTLEPVFCLGNCALSPSIMIDGEVFGRVSPVRFDALVTAATASP